ncbi:MAG: sigma-E factor negative regulatory protein [Candidatus Endonucleobacter sp. (ex Gigantidas childressi)]|nr:sigma-E factor negative regulatory protein [Candidatus Endonucleobacter sp. (ex Gigantidas childressi)]
MSKENLNISAKDRLSESLSVVLDGQASEFELRRVLDGISNDEELRQAAFRYQRIGDVIRGDADKFADVDLSGRVMTAIGTDSKNKTSNNKFRRSVWDDVKSSWIFRNWYSYVSGGAVAASVVLAVVMSFRNYNDQPSEELLADESSSIFSGILSDPAQVGSNYYGVPGILASYHSQQKENVSEERLINTRSAVDQAVRSRFLGYALQHAELAAMSTSLWILPFARLTGADVE